MDPLSISASIAALVALTQSIVTVLGNAKGWSKEMKALELELKGLEDVIHSLESITGSLQSRSEDTSGSFCPQFVLIRRCVQIFIETTRFLQKYVGRGQSGVDPTHGVQGFPHWKYLEKRKIRHQTEGRFG
jgi:hypothetical protein